MITAEITTGFYAYTTVSARATMEFEAGRTDDGSATLASDAWIAMYPG